MNAHKAAQVLNLPNLLDAKDDAPRLLKLAMRAATIAAHHTAEAPLRHKVAAQVYERAARELAKLAERHPEHIDVSFAPCDRLNPGFGYMVEVRDARTGEYLFRGGNNPKTGNTLMSPVDCLEVIGMFTGHHVTRADGRRVRVSVPKD